MNIESKLFFIHVTTLTYSDKMFLITKVKMNQIICCSSYSRNAIMFQFNSKGLDNTQRQRLFGDESIVILEIL